MSEIKFLKRLKETPKKNTNIYALKTPPFSLSVLAEVSKAFKLQGDKKKGRFSIDEKTATYTEGPHVVKLYKNSGALKYYDSVRWQVDDGKSTLNISDQRATTIAENFIKKTSLVPLAESDLLKVTHLHVGTLERNTKKVEERIIDAGIVFQRKIDNVPVEGPGGKAVVYIDHNGEVTGCERIWRNIDKVIRKVPFQDLKAPVDAERDLGVYWKKIGLQRIEVEDQRFGYFELGKMASQTYLQAAYIMPLKIFAMDGRSVMKSAHVTLAPLKPVGRIMPAKRVFVVPKHRVA